MSKLGRPPRQLTDRLAIGWRKGPLHRLLPGQPELGYVLGRVEGGDGRAVDQEAEHMLGVVRDVGRILCAPLPPDLVAVDVAPVGQRADRQPGLLEKLAPRRGYKVGIVWLARARHRLPRAPRAPRDATGAAAQ